jgi:CBS domain-containing membrane protein
MIPGTERGNVDHVEVLLAHLLLGWLLHRFSPRLVWAAYVCVNCFITIGLLALLALVTGSPFVFPSLSPTAYLFFFSPLAEASSPRNAILGHAIGLMCGYAAFALTMAYTPPFRTRAGIDGPTVLAAALSLSLFRLASSRRPRISSLLKSQLSCLRRRL